MTDLARDRATTKKATTAYRDQNVGDAAAAGKHYIGLMQVVDVADGIAKNPSAALAAQVVAGVVKDRVDNTDGAAGDKKVELETGVFQFDLHATNTPTAADLFQTVYASDNHTISNDPADGPIAGTMTALYSSSCDVDIDPTK